VLLKDRSAELLRQFVAGPAVRHNAHAVRGAADASATLVSRGDGFSWDTDKRPEMPRDMEEMVQQAADSVMRAYREGHTRQAVRLRLDQVFDLEQIYLKGQAALLNASLPLMRSFTGRLWGNDHLKQLRVSIVDEEVATLLYREAESEQMDMAILYLAGRKFMATPEAQTFVGNMKDRLVVIANAEEAPDPFRVENKGTCFTADLSTKFGEGLCETFAQQSYYYFAGPFNNWQLTTFRAYPYPFEYWIEDLDKNLVKIGESEKKLLYDDIIAIMSKYEKENNVKPTQKVGKMFKMFQEQEAASEAREPGWRALSSMKEDQND
jgi:hypothetical protein